MNRACKIIVIGAFLFAAISFAVEERYPKDIILTIDARHPTEDTFPNILLVTLIVGSWVILLLTPKWNFLNIVCLIM